MRGSNQRRTSKKRRYVDVLGLDNEQDYDPLWQACVELGVAVTFHDGAVSWQNRASVTNYVYNHVGHFAEANHAVCKAVFLGGVTRRFPDLRFGFLEGGAGWARNLYLDLIGHFEKRSLEATRAHLDPALFDAEEFGRLYDRYGGPDFADHRDAVIENILAGGRVEDRHIDDFAACGCTSREGVAAEFSRNFFFGCEADDPMTATAFDARLGKPLKAVFSSDIGHWDVPIINNVLPEAYELLEHGLLDEESFRRFTFGNAVELHGGMNPDFFKGTRVEKEAAQELGPRAASAH